VVADVDRDNNTSRFAVNRFLDTDGDGMPDQWERDNFLDPNNPGDASADLDGDGVRNLAEYRAGTDPGDARAYLKLAPLSLTDTAGSVRITWGSAPNKLYTLLRSTAVDTGWSPVAEHVLSTPPENVFLDQTAPNARVYFYRLRVE